MSDTTTTADIKPILMDAKSAAAMLSISVETLRRWTRKGKIRRLKIDNTLRYAVAEIEAMVAKESQRETEDQAWPALAATEPGIVSFNSSPPTASGERSVSAR